MPGVQGIASAELVDEVGARNLARAVIERAFRDVRLYPGRSNDMHRFDALEFLTIRLWTEDCLWQGLLMEALVRRYVVEEARKRFRGRQHV